MGKFSINTQAHKRKFYPSYGKFSCYTTRYNGTWVLRNGTGETLFEFESEEQKTIHAGAMINILKIMYRNMEDEYLSHKRFNPQYYYPTYEEANFTHRALMNGFEPRPENFDPYNNWFGLSTYDPDARLTRGNKTIILSLQGIGMPEPKEITDGWYEVAKQGALKYLCFYIDEKVIYETWFGQLPEMDFIEQFISLNK